MTHIVEFSFQNDDYNLIEEAKEDVYLKIERVVRTKPYDGMKQPTPFGGLLGLETVMTVKYRGNVGQYAWELINGGSCITGMTDAKGVHSGLPVPMAYGNPKIFRLKILISVNECTHGSD